MGGAGGSLPEQGVGNGRSGKGGGRYGAATEGVCCGRRGDERAIRRGGSSAGGMAQAGKMRLRNLFGRFFSYTLGYVICQYKQLKKLTGEENC